jgi:hypothetical protein
MIKLKYIFSLLTVEMFFLPYQAEISRANPSCFLLLIDQSGSMEDPFGKGDPTQPRKADGVADVVNRLLQNMIIRCAKTEGVRDYYYIGAIGYGGQVRRGFGAGPAEQDLVPISKISSSPIRVEDRTRKTADGAGGIVEEKIKFPIWFDPVANSGTPMCEALSLAEEMCQRWTTAHPSSFPPTVINITDGEATDGDPLPIAEKVKSIAAEDGSTLLFNVHLSSVKSTPIEFPDNEETLPDKFARLLFAMSSTLPDHIRNAAQQEGYKITENSRGFVFNADMVSLIRFLEIGTRPSQLR